MIYIKNHCQSADVSSESNAVLDSHLHTTVCVQCTSKRPGHMDNSY